MASPKTIQDRLSEGGAGPITIQALGELLAVAGKELQALVDHGYLRVVIRKDPFDQTVVSCPKPEALTWLRTMFSPLHMRPLVRLGEVHHLLRKYQGRMKRNAEDRVRQICLSYGIPIYIDPVFGELLTIEGLYQAAYHLGIYRNPVRHNRVTMLAFLLNALPTTGPYHGNRGKALKIPKYTARLAREINRIAQLPVEQRTVMAMNLYEAWRDARAVQECLTKIRDLEGRTVKFSRTIRDIQDIDYRMEKLVKRVST